MAAHRQHPELDPDRPGWTEPMSRQDRLLTACAWCDRVRVGDDWVSAEVAIRTLRTFDWAEPPLFTHGICEDCFAFMTGSRASDDGASADKAA